MEERLLPETLTCMDASSVSGPLYLSRTLKVIFCLTFHRWRNQDSRQLRENSPKIKDLEGWTAEIQASGISVFEGHSFNVSLEAANSEPIENTPINCGEKTTLLQLLFVFYITYFIKIIPLHFNFSLK